MSLVTRKPVFGMFDHVRLKPACSAIETSLSLEISAIASRGIIVSRQRTAKALIRLHSCAGWSAPILFTYGTKQVFLWLGSCGEPNGYSQQTKSIVPIICVNFAHDCSDCTKIRKISGAISIIIPPANYVLFSRCPCVRPWCFGFSLISWKGSDGNSSNFADALIVIICMFIIENEGLGANSLGVIALCNS